MVRTVLIITAVAIVSLWSSLARATEIVILKSADLPYYDQAVLGFRSALPDRTHVTEINLSGNLTRGREVATGLRASPPDLVLAVGLKAALAAKLEIFDTPVVYCLVLNPEAHGLSASNMSGIAMRTSAEAQLDALRVTLPQRRRIGILYDEDKSAAFVTQAKSIAKKWGFELTAVPLSDRTLMPQALRQLVPTIDVLWLIQDQTVVNESSIPMILETTMDAKIPVFTFSSTLVQQGAVAALVVDAWSVGQQAARLSQTRLRQPHAPAGYVLQPENSQLTLNLASAEHFGVNPSPEAIRMAAQLFGGPGPLARKETPVELIP